MENANLSRSLRRTFYSLTRRYGKSGTIVRKLTSGTDYATGVVSETHQSATIRNLVLLPVDAGRQIIYTASMMQSLRTFAWQGGGMDTQETMFMILETDLRNWGQIEASQWLTLQGKSYEVSEALQMPGGWILTAVRVEGQAEGLPVQGSDGLGLEEVADES